MDKDVIRKIINHRGEPCPRFKYKKPLLDKSIANLLSERFIRLLKNQNSNNTNHRTLILENIRRSCKIEPPNHLNIDDNLIEIIRSAYEELPDNCNIHKDLDSFLLRNLKEMDISAHHSPSFTPDIAQALVNLNGAKQEIYDVVLRDIIYWNVDDSSENGYLDTLESMWNVQCITNLTKTQSDDISLKMKPTIEKLILSSVPMTQNVVNVDVDDWFPSNNDDIQKLITMASVSSQCFQICCSVMNSIFISTQFDKQMCNFIKQFIDCIKFEVQNISELYQSNLKNIVLLLDIELESLEGEIQTAYILHTLEHLHSLRKECESDVIMVLSHFDKQWFEHYFNKQHEIQKNMLH